MIKDFLAGLNQEQLKAVEAIEGPVLVAAGPGTGKTQILAARIANILTKTDVPPDAVLALTFTESGVRAMRERLLKTIGPTAYYVNIATFHSFCSDIIKGSPDQFAMVEDLEPLSDLQRLQIFREILDKGEFNALKPFTNHYFYVPAIIKALQELKREGVTPDEFEKLSKDNTKEASVDEVTSKSAIAEREKNLEKQRELFAIYKTYEETLKTKGLFDFEDMINFVVEKFKTDEEFLRKYQERYQYILVDEFQDTNNAQNEVLRLLASFWDEPNIFVVGDANQSIYRFQGASTENMVGFVKRYKNCQKISLTKNYRSSQIILDAATELISKNELRLSKIFSDIPEGLEAAAVKDGPKILVGEFGSATTENFFVGNKVKELIDGGLDSKEIAVIYRHNKDSDQIADTLDRLGIEYDLEGGNDVLEDYDIQKFLLLLKAIDNARRSTDDLDWFTLFNYEFLKIDALDVLKLARFASNCKINFVEAINHQDFEKNSKVKNVASFKDFLTKLLAWEKADSQKTFVEFFEQVLNESGFLEWLLNLPDAHEKLNKINSLFSEVKKLNLATRTLGLSEFLKNLEIMQNNHLNIAETVINVSQNAVRLTTAHRAKGLEFKVVFIIGCLDKKWGNNSVRELIKLPEGILKNTDLSKKEKNEDERRLFYVALTRAKSQVYLTYALSGNGENSKGAVPSMFIAEISEDKKEKIDPSKFEDRAIEIVKEVLQPVPASTEKALAEEKEFLAEVLRDFKLSVTALNTYTECHYKFKLNNLLRTPRAKSRSLSLGTAVHMALDKFFQEYKVAGVLPKVDLLTTVFIDAATKELLSPKDLKAVLTQGQKILNSYYESNRANLVKPLYTEKLFGYGYGKIYLDDIPLVGKVDRVDVIDPVKKLVRVVDYKTGKPKTRGDIEGTTKYSDGAYKQQLVFYKLLTELDRTFNGYEVAETELDFVGDRGNDGKKEVFVITKAETDNLKDVIRKTMVNLRGLDFARTTNLNACKFCDYQKHCWPNGLPTAKDEQIELNI
ncbi:MAG: ATP-dependent DNA helicase [candidate division WWE3 bacterium]|nr:ATP-dependent DNA helicase [candidate division WWE3 bacterium]